MYPQGKHILVIESETRRQHQAERLLAEEGFAVTAVSEGFSAIRVAAGCRFSLAVVAPDLPGMLDGVTTLRQIRMRQPWLRALFVGVAAARPQWLDPDCEDFIAAPMHRRDLLGCVFELLQRDGERVRAG